MVRLILHLLPLVIGMDQEEGEVENSRSIIPRRGRRLSSRAVRRRGMAVTASMPVHILLTKADKLKRGPAQNTLLSVRSELATHAELVSVQCFSSLKRQGINELGKQINRWLTDESVMDPPPETPEAE